MKKLSTLAIVGLSVFNATILNAQQLKMTKVATHYTGEFDESAAEIVAL